MSAYLIKSKGKKNWTSVCHMITDTQCDFSTSLQQYYYGLFIIRLRANSFEEHSPWIKREFCPDKDADLGPPSKVDVISTNGMLEVSISDPMSTQNISMKTKIEIAYKIVYCEYLQLQKSENCKAIESENNVITLSKLKPWTVYCVRVQALSAYYEKKSPFTPVLCRQTTDDGTTPVWLLALTFLMSSALSVSGILLTSFILYKCYRMVKYTFFPSYKPPANIQEFLYEVSPSSDYPRLLTVESQVELCCEKLNVIPEEILEISLQIQLPLEMEIVPHNQQDSGDSGFYCSEEGSGGSCSSWQQELQNEYFRKGENASLLENSRPSLCVSL
ncbi:interferon alpha/beta receptor 1a isoform X2 [Amia ocellicauda]|uniref:interferon alpha/beta receptor 1a isoform X2 n=1 Tax=Amia ocellicauda TaxID=2972642 RepID=UPI0034648B6A